MRGCRWAASLDFGQIGIQVAAANMLSMSKSGRKKTVCFEAVTTICLQHLRCNTHKRTELRILLPSAREGISDVVREWAIDCQEGFFRRYPCPWKRPPVGLEPFGQFRAIDARSVEPMAWHFPRIWRNCRHPRQSCECWLASGRCRRPRPPLTSKSVRQFAPLPICRPTICERCPA